VWTRTVNGRALHFYLAGINNQNFLMRDKETGTWWQQITGKAIYGPLRGAALELVLSDELTFGEWKSEVSDGNVSAEVLKEVPKYGKEYDSNWEPEVAKLPVVISFPGTALKSRDVVVGLEIDGASRAYPWDALAKQSPVVDRVHGTPLLAAVGPDGKSFRVFISRIDGKDAEFFLKADAPETPATEKPEALAGTKPAAPVDAKASDSKPDENKAAVAQAPDTKSADAKPADAKPSDAKADASTSKVASPAPLKPWILLDTTTASEWNFQGCAISGPSQGKCLDRVPALKDYWFDWRNYHPDTSIYKR
jgi:Protein of unknown function (DUF3179)